MITEKGTLLIGVEYEGKTHREFELRPQLVKDSIEAMEDERARENESYLGVVILSKSLISLGDIPKDKIDADLLMGMYPADLQTIDQAAQEVQARLISFRGEGKVPKEEHSGDAEVGVQPVGDKGNA